MKKVLLFGLAILFLAGVPSSTMANGPVYTAIFETISSVGQAGFEMPAVSGYATASLKHGTRRIFCNVSATTNSGITYEFELVRKSTKDFYTTNPITAVGIWDVWVTEGGVRTLACEGCVGKAEKVGAGGGPVEYQLTVGDALCHDQMWYVRGELTDLYIFD